MASWRCPPRPDFVELPKDSSRAQFASSFTIEETNYMAQHLSWAGRYYPAVIEVVDRNIDLPG
jgi:hypothetical protein